MDHFAGLDVSVKETGVCIVDDLGKIVREVKVASEREALLAVLKNPAYHFKRIGLATCNLLDHPMSSITTVIIWGFPTRRQSGNRRTARCF
jgi:RNase H-fold protein (predicted Holliday junction resolvase)